MLKVGAPLTGVGELVLDHSCVRLQPPKVSSSWGGGNLGWLTPPSALGCDCSPSSGPLVVCLGSPVILGI